MKSKHVLVVDDAKDIQKVLEYNLKKEGYEVSLAGTGEEALKRLEGRTPDLVILDLMLPGTDGLEVCRMMRANPKTRPIPVLMLTAKGSETDQVVGLELGADDYVTKPFSARELVARVRAVLRRAQIAAAPADLVRAGEIEIDVPRMNVSIAGRDVEPELTASEFALLLAMARQPGRVFTRAQLLDALRGEAFEAYERAIDAHVKNIRRKIEPDPKEPRYLLTVFGVGYRVAESS